MPAPREDETKQEFISRCISYVTKEKDWDQKRISAYCYSIWNDAKKAEIAAHLAMVKGRFNE